MTGPTGKNVRRFSVSVRVAGLEPTVEEAIAVAEEYVKAGCDYLQVSHGMTDLKECPPYKDSAVSTLASLGVYFHEHFKDRIPVSCVGGHFHPGTGKPSVRQRLCGYGRCGKSNPCRPGICKCGVTEYQIYQML